jgi:hypothetical protein
MVLAIRRLAVKNPTGRACEFAGTVHRFDWKYVFIKLSANLHVESLLLHAGELSVISLAFSRPTVVPHWQPFGNHCTI